MKLFTRILHSIVARPAVYDLVQWVLGATVMRRRMAARIAALGPVGRILDVGGGTGAGREATPPDATYLCLDIDPVKIEGFCRKNPHDFAIVADATRMPLPDASFDVAILMFVAHHLDDVLLERFMEEAARVLKPTGHLVFADPLWVPSRWAGRMLWRYDRGSSPRTAATLRRMLASRFEIDTWEQFSVWHEYVLATARPRPRPVSAAQLARAYV